MIKYPVTFVAKAKSHSGIQSLWLIESQKQQMICGIPPEFEGPGGALSPEDLFAQALTNCFLATFKVYAEKSRVNYAQIAAAAELIVDLDEKNKPVMKKLILHAEIFECDNVERGKALAERAFASGFILNSVKTELELDVNVGSV